MSGLVIMWVGCLTVAVVLLALTGRLWWLRRGRPVETPSTAMFALPACTLVVLVIPVVVVNMTT